MTPVPEIDRKLEFCKAMNDEVRLNVNVVPLSVTVQRGEYGVEGSKTHGSVKETEVPSSITLKDPAPSTTIGLLKSTMLFAVAILPVSYSTPPLAPDAKVMEPLMNAALAVEPNASAADTARLRNCLFCFMVIWG